MRGPPAGTVATAAAALAGLVAFTLSGVGLVATLAGVAGLTLLVGAPLVPSGRFANAGGALLFGAVLLAAAGPLSPTATVAAGVATLLAWTWSHTAAGLRQGLGDADAGGLEVAHVAGTTGLAGAAAVVAVVAYAPSLPTVSPSALALLVVGAAAMAVSLRRRP